MIWGCLNIMVDPLPLIEIDIGNNNNQNLLDNLTIIDNTIEFEEGHYFKANNSDTTITFQIDNYSSIPDHSNFSLKTKDYLNPGMISKSNLVYIFQIFGIYQMITFKFVKNTVKLKQVIKGDTLELTVSLDVLDDMAMLKYNVILYHLILN